MQSWMVRWPHTPLPPYLIKYTSIWDELGPSPCVDLQGVADVWDQELGRAGWRGWCMEDMLGSLFREWWLSLLLLLSSLLVSLQAGLLLLLCSPSLMFYCPVSWALESTLCLLLWYLSKINPPSVLFICLQGMTLWSHHRCCGDAYVYSAWVLSTLPSTQTSLNSGRYHYLYYFHLEDRCPLKISPLTFDIFK